MYLPQDFLQAFFLFIKELKRAMYRALLVTFLAIISMISSAYCFEINMSVQERNQAGAKWDRTPGLSAPDLALCVHDSFGFRCMLDASNHERHKAYCNNSYVCDFPVTYFPDDTFVLEVLDMERSGKSERIGAATCRRGERCLVGM